MEGTTERIMAPRRKVREAIRRGREPQEKTRMVREGTERRMTPRRRRMVRVAKRRGREPQEKTRMGRMVRRRRRETAERAKMVLITKTKEQRRMEGTTERIMAPRRKVREAIRRGREPQEKTRMVRE